MRRRSSVTVGAEAPREVPAEVSDEAPEATPDELTVKEVHSRGENALAMRRPGELDASLANARTRAAVDVADLDVTLVSVTAGPETYSPIRYYSFTVGPCRVESRVRPGESVEDAYRRAHTHAHMLLDVEYDLAVQRHLSRVRSVNEAAKAQASATTSDRSDERRPSRGWDR